MMQSNPQSNPVLEWISNPGAIHQKGMQSGFCNPAITILPMPEFELSQITWHICLINSVIITDVVAVFPKFFFKIGM